MAIFGCTRRLEVRGGATEEQWKSGRDEYVRRIVGNWGLKGVWEKGKKDYEVEEKKRK